jgi:hypothetical protein
MSKEEIMAAIRKCAKELGHTPNFSELMKRTPMSRRRIRRLFGSYGMAVRACGMKHQCGAPVSLDELFLDWAKIVRKLKRVPTIFEYKRESAFSPKPLATRCKGWRRVPATMLKHMERQGLKEQWPDVAEAIRTDRPATWKRKAAAKADGGLRRARKILKDRQTYGPPLTKSGMACGPENELGVLFLFGMLAWQLGFVVQRIQMAFPDCQALRKVDEQTWQNAHIEFEYESRNFLRHMHPVNGCDLIVCWIHNWPECPLEVVELSKVEWRLCEKCGGGR